MSENSLGTSIEDYLLSLASSIQRAQQELNKLRVEGPDGKSSIYYQLPQLEFELKLAFQLTESTEEVGTRGTGQQGRMVMNATPASQLDSSSSTTSAASTIKGTFVAVPTEGGRPQARIQTSIEKIDTGKILMTVAIRSATGEPFPGVEVHFNIDRDWSTSMSRENSLEISLNENTQLFKGIVTTDKNGIAQNTLLISPDEVVGTYVGVIIDALGKTETLSYEVNTIQN